MSKEMQKVKVWVSVQGYYCSFREMRFDVVYDITNDSQWGNKTLEELENHTFDEYIDYQKRDAIKIDGRYYVLWQ